MEVAMSCRGVCFAITAAQTKKLLELEGDDESLLSYVIDEIEERWDKKHLVELDKSWDAMHRCLTDGKLKYKNGKFPLSHCVLGGKPLYSEGDYIVSIKTVAEVKAVADGLKIVTKDWMQERYKKIKGYAPEWGEKDFEYTWQYFTEVREFYARAAKSKRAVIFTADQ